MRAVLYRARAEMRGAWRGAAVVALLVALLGGTVLAAAAGARRTETAYPRMLAASVAADVLTGPSDGAPEDQRALRDAVYARPEVAHAGEVMGVPILPERGTPTAELVDEGQEFESTDLGLPLSPVDGTWGYDFNRPIVRAGRMPEPDALDEVLISTQHAARSGLRVGDVLDVVLVDPSVDLDSARDAAADQGIPLHLRVTGIGSWPTEVIPISDLDEVGLTLLPPAFADLVRTSGFATLFEVYMLDLAPGTDVGAFGHRVGDIASALGAGERWQLLFTDEQANADQVQSAITPLSAALGAFAVVVGLVGLLVAGQAVGRHTRLVPDEVGALAAIGSSRASLTAVPVIRALVIGILGATGAVVLAVAASGRFPVGPARRAEPEPGIHVDAAVLALGFVAIVALVSLSALPGALLRARARLAAGRPPRARGAALVGRTALGVVAAQGVRFAFDGSDRNRPVRSTLLAAATAAAFVLAAATFAASLTSLVDQPARWGQGWDRMADGQFAPVAAGTLVDELDRLPEVTGISGGSYVSMEVAGQATPGVTMLDLRGDAGLTVVDGRRAERPGEIALGLDVMRRAGISIGDLVDVDTGRGPTRLRVVGRVLFPRLTRGSFNGTGLGLGAQIHPDDAPTYDPTADGELPDGMTLADFSVAGRYFGFLTIDVDGDAARVDRVLSDGQEQMELTFWQRESPPTAIADLDRVRSVPLILAAFLALAAAATLAHLLFTSVRANRRELALLSTLGFRSRQLRGAIAWQATLVAGAAAVVGVPLGVAIGGQLWRTFASGIGAPSPAEVPWAWVALLAPAAVALANAVAAVPSWRASRIRPAVVLRGER